MTAVAELDALGAGGDRREQDLRCRHGEVVAVVLADAEHVDAERVGEHALLDRVADHLRIREAVAVAVDGHVAEGVESEFESHVSMKPYGPRLIPRPPRWLRSAAKRRVSKPPPRRYTACGYRIAGVGRSPVVNRSSLCS